MRFLVLLALLLVVSSCQINKEYEKINKSVNNYITGSVVISKPIKENITNYTFIINHSNSGDKIEEYKAKSSIVSTENKIKEIYELLEDLEDKDVISKYRKNTAIKKLDKVKEDFNISYGYFNDKRYELARKTSIKTNKDAREIVRTL